jgi:hypothetical protein
MGSSGSLVSKVGRVAIGLHYLLGKHNLLYIGDLNLPNCIPSRAPKFNKVLISRMEQLILEMLWYEMKLILSNKIIIYFRTLSTHFFQTWKSFLQQFVSKPMVFAGCVICSLFLVLNSLHGGGDNCKVGQPYHHKWSHSPQCIRQYAKVNYLIRNEHLYLNGMWLDVGPRTNTRKTMCLKEIGLHAQ